MQDFWVSAFFVEVAIKGNLTHQETTKLTEEISTVVFHTNKGTFNKKHTPPLVLKPGDSLVFERTQFHSDLSRCFVFLQTGSGPELNVICDFGVWECGKDEAAGLVVTNEFTT
ncbi:hypothetical protein L596_027166 [Steinernema carpocapsae]|uniref:Uncharacterized protein n=1 Tax=Steinernema carpocapsae TaxID=34508 RepID=A0A4U5M3I1_STECR|nr:hypothetical protein L596_027166 [Steinernema carpocapsae]